MVSRFLFTKMDNSPLVLFRIFFGILISLECFGAILTGWVKTNLARFPRTQNEAGDNLEHLSLLIHSLENREIRDITIDLNRVRKIDQESITYLLHLSIDLKRRGGSLNLLGPQKDIIKLKKQYDTVM